MRCPHWDHSEHQSHRYTVHTSKWPDPGLPPWTPGTLPCIVWPRHGVWLHLKVCWHPTLCVVCCSHKLIGQTAHNLWIDFQILCLLSLEEGANCSLVSNVLLDALRGSGNMQYVAAFGTPILDNSLAWVTLETVVMPEVRIVSTSVTQVCCRFPQIAAGIVHCVKNKTIEIQVN